jgi:Rrf2 family protein
MKISTRSRYGLRFLIELARHTHGNPVLLGEIATNQNISEKYLSKLVISLRGAGLIRSVRGACGGYVLARPPREISLREIIDALEGGHFIIRCVDSPGNCPASRTCVARGVWGGLEKVMRDYCETLTLDEIVRRGLPSIPRGAVRSIRDVGNPRRNP